MKGSRAYLATSKPASKKKERNHNADGKGGKTATLRPSHGRGKMREGERMGLPWDRGGWGLKRSKKDKDKRATRKTELIGKTISGTNANF